MWIHGAKFAIAFWVMLPEDEEHAIFAHDLQSALRLTVGIFHKFVVSCDICRLNITVKLK